ncbi:MAG: hypothetical protein AAF485_05485, partial [Chloroflexota bacterium]
QRGIILVVGLFMGLTLACLTNTSSAGVPSARPTRTPLPTFTTTALPPTKTLVPTATPVLLVAATTTPTETPEATETPIPTETVEPTETATPVPDDTATPVPPTAAPPTATATNTAVANSPVSAPVATSPLPTPTNTPDPGSPPGRYEAVKEKKQNNCFDVGVTGFVGDKGSGAPIEGVTIEVTGHNGPYRGTTDAQGRYNIFIGSLDDVGKKDFRAIVFGDPATVISEDDPTWTTSTDCNDSNGIQVMEIDWSQKNL